jgi:valyl-tRNA synthetase
MGEVPFRTVYIHALVRDAKGQKMSKTRGNVIDPLEIIDKYGADALRFTLMAMAAQGRDIRLSEERVEGYRNFSTKLWNAARYAQMNDCAADASFDPAAVSYTPNKWIIGELARMNAAVEQAIAEYKFNDAAGVLYHFVWNTFCDWYLEFTKPLLAGDSPVSGEIRQVTAWVLQQVLVILNPFMPFITEELNRTFSGSNEMLLTGKWPEYAPGLMSGEAAAELDWLIRFISEIRSVRSDMNVPAAAKIRLLVREASAQTQARLKAYDEIIVRMARLESVEITPAQPPVGSIQTVVDEATLILPIATIIDLDKERQRLQKEIDRLRSDISKIDQKLGNEQFVRNAPPEVVEEQRTRRNEAENVLHKLSNALEQLAAA